MKVYEAVARTLRELRVDRVFGVMGAANLQWVTTLADLQQDVYVAATHEAGAVAMADGWSRLADRPGIATVTHGPGITNGLTALTEASRAGSSLLVLTGSCSPQHSQWLDLRAAANLAGAGFHEVASPMSVSDDLASAYQTASVRHRPVLVDIPARMLNLEAGEITANRGFGPWSVPRPAPDDDVLDSALGVIASARHPLILVGRGAALSNARTEVYALAKRLCAPLTTTVMAMNFCSDYPLHLGIFGSESHSLALKCIREADCIIVLGANLNRDTTANGDLLRGKAVVRCDSDPSVISAGNPKWVSVFADVKVFSTMVNRALEDVLEERDSTWSRSIGEELETFNPDGDFVDASGISHVDLRSAMVALNRILPMPRVVVTDTGRFKTAPWRHLRCTEGAFTQSGSFKGIGLGLPMAIGASFAHRGVVTICVAGDGGAMMSIGELAVAVEHKLPLVVVIANDSAYGSEYSLLAECGLNPNYSRRLWPTFASLGSAFGARGYAIRTLRTLDGLESGLRDVCGPLLLDIKLDVAMNPRKYR